MTVVFIDGERIYLRPHEEADLETFRTWFNHPELRHYLMGTMPLTSADEAEWFERARKETNSIRLSIAVKETDELIGTIALINIDNTHRSGTLGIAIGDLSQTDKGYGSEAIGMILDHGFEELNLHRIDLLANEYNERAIAVYRKLGFHEEGRMRESHYHQGRYWDRLMMSVLKEEWLDRGSE